MPDLLSEATLVAPELQIHPLQIKKQTYGGRPSEAQQFRDQNAYKAKKSPKRQNDVPLMRAAEQEWLQEDVPATVLDDSSTGVDTSRLAKPKFDWRSQQLRYNARPKDVNGSSSIQYPPRRIRPAQVTVNAEEAHGPEIARYHNK